MKQKTVLLSVGMQPYLPAIALLTILFAAKENVIWGIAYPAVKGELAIQSFFRWHLLTIPPLLFASGYISTMRTMAVFIRVRVRSDKRLYRSLVLTCLAASSLWGLFLSATALALNPADPRGVLVVLLGHIMWMSMYLAVYFALHSVSAALVIMVLLIGMVFYVGELMAPRWPFLPTSWAMPARTEVFDAQGISLPLALGGCLGVTGLSLMTTHFIYQQRRLRL